MADGVWKGVQSLVIGRSDQPSQNKSFDLSTPSMRTGSDGGEKEIMFIVATNVIVSRPPERRQTGTPTARAKRT